MTKPSLDKRLCFNVYSLHHQISRFYNKSVLTEMEITYPQFLVLNILLDKEQVNIKMLAETLRLDTGTISPLIKRMERLGLVHRFRNPTDQRLVILEPTEHGRKMGKQLEEAFEAFDDVISLTTEEESLFLEYIQHLNVRLAEKNAARK
ncbi:MarR family winged helix-turn-helix transcriptional regulator [Salinicoccus siamensis]|uniref:MarR family winged helix-turn-helix transcriptional regulator n=1 Tax=Salinicoccus siamensis TaxID=381830 RepID=A0ABV5Z0C2_9STAP